MNGLISLRNLIYETIMEVIAVKENQRDHESENDSGSDASSLVSQYFREQYQEKHDSSQQESQNPNISIQNQEKGGKTHSILKNSSLNKTFNSQKVQIGSIDQSLQQIKQKRKELTDILNSDYQSESKEKQNASEQNKSQNNVNDQQIKKGIQQSLNGQSKGNNSFQQTYLEKREALLKLQKKQMDECQNEYGSECEIVFYQSEKSSLFNMPLIKNNKQHFLEKLDSPRQSSNQLLEEIKEEFNNEQIISEKKSNNQNNSFEFEGLEKLKEIINTESQQDPEQKSQNSKYCQSVQNQSLDFQNTEKIPERYLESENNLGSQKSSHNNIINNIQDYHNNLKKFYKKIEERSNQNSSQRMRRLNIHYHLTNQELTPIKSIDQTPQSTVINQEQNLPQAIQQIRDNFITRNNFENKHFTQVIESNIKVDGFQNYQNQSQFTLGKIKSEQQSIIPQNQNVPSFLKQEEDDQQIDNNNFIQNQSQNLHEETNLGKENVSQQNLKEEGQIKNKNPFIQPIRKVVNTDLQLRQNQSHNDLNKDAKTITDNHKEQSVSQQNNQNDIPSFKAQAGLQSNFITFRNQPKNPFIKPIDPQRSLKNLNDQRNAIKNRKTWEIGQTQKQIPNFLRNSNHKDEESKDEESSEEQNNQKIIHKQIRF